jgi:hypothetical protein
MKLTVKQVVERLSGQVSPSMVYQWIEQERLPHFRLGGDGKRGKILIEEGDLDAFIDSCRIGDTN